MCNPNFISYFPFLSSSLPFPKPLNWLNHRRPNGCRRHLRRRSSSLDSETRPSPPPCSEKVVLLSLFRRSEFSAAVLLSRFSSKNLTLSLAATARTDGFEFSLYGWSGWDLRWGCLLQSSVFQSLISYSLWIHSFFQIGYFFCLFACDVEVQFIDQWNMCQDYSVWSNWIEFHMFGFQTE